MRYAVGGAQRVVIAYLRSISNVSMALNLPRASCINIAAPITHGPNRLLHAALAQPISERFQCRSSSCRSSQYLPVMVRPMGELACVGRTILGSPTVPDVK